MISKFEADLHLRWRFTAGTVLAPPQNQQVLPSPEKLPKLDFHNHLSQQHKQGEKKKKRTIITVGQDKTVLLLRQDLLYPHSNHTCWELQRLHLYNHKQ